MCPSGHTSWREHCILPACAVKKIRDTFPKDFIFQYEIDQECFGNLVLWCALTVCLVSSGQSSSSPPSCTSSQIWKKDLPRSLHCVMAAIIVDCLYKTITTYHEYIFSHFPDNMTSRFVLGAQNGVAFLFCLGLCLATTWHSSRKLMPAYVIPCIRAYLLLLHS